MDGLDGRDPRLSWRMRLIEELSHLSYQDLPPLNPEHVILAEQRVVVRYAAEYAEKDRRWLLSWLLRRYLRGLRPNVPKARHHPSK